VGAIHRVTMTSFRSISMPAGFRRHLVGKLSEMFLTVMGVNATGTLAGRRSSAEDARIEAPYAARGVGLGMGRAPSQKICKFFVSKWCDTVHSGCVVF